MQKQTPDIAAASDQARSGIRDDSRKGKLPCGARFCYRCHEECGGIVNAYIMRDWANEPADD